MNYPYMLIMRNSHGGSIWQAYEVRDDKEVELLTKTARHNGFLVESQQVGYADETCPGWRDSEDWKNYRAGILTGRALGQQQCREILKDIIRDGPYWLGGYHDWLVSCWSLTGPDCFRGFTPIACWSEISPRCDKYPQGCCTQYLVCTKEGQYYVDILRGAEQHGVNGYGVDPNMKLATEQTYAPHIYDWIFKYVLPVHRGEIPRTVKPAVQEAGASKPPEVRSHVADDVTPAPRRRIKRAVTGHARRKPAARRVAKKA